MSINFHAEDRGFMLTDDHPYSSQGQIVLIVDEESYRPYDVLWVQGVRRRACEIVASWLAWSRDSLSPQDLEFASRFA